MTDFGTPATTGQALSVAHIEHHNGLAAGLYVVNTQSVATSYTIPLGAAHKLTMTGNTTFTFTAPTTSSLGTVSHSFIVHLSGAYAPTWPGAVKWDSGAAPTYTSPAVYVFTTFDSGTTWFGSQVGKGFA